MKSIADPNPPLFNPYEPQIKYLIETMQQWQTYDTADDDEKRAMLWAWGSWHRRGLLMLGANVLASDQEKQVIGVLYGRVGSILADMIAIKAGLSVVLAAEQLMTVLQEHIETLQSYTVEFPQLKY